MHGNDRTTGTTRTARTRTRTRTGPGRRPHFPGAVAPAGGRETSQDVGTDLSRAPRATTTPCPVFGVSGTRALYDVDDRTFTTG